MTSRIVRFAREFFDPAVPFTFIGDGELGGKAQGLAAVQETLATRLDRGGLLDIEVAIPYLTVITTQAFDAFMETNELEEVALAELPDDRIAHAFLKAELPVFLVGDLRALVARVHQPLAVRSSSLLEDAVGRPFAGVYATKMTPNNQLDEDSRFRKLVDAIKLVYASTYFREARTYRRFAGAAEGAEKMAVIIQEVVGARHGERFYPDLSGVARSTNYYPSGHARPEDGVASLALGLGKTIVDGGQAWSYSPAYPKSPPPFKSTGEMLKATQTTFWAVNMGTAPYDPARETEHMVQAPLSDAEADGVLRFVASTYDTASDRLRPGVFGAGPRVVNFAPLLAGSLVPINELVRALLAACEDAAGGGVEIELAVTLDPRHGVPARCGFLQVRRLVTSGEDVEVGEDELSGPRVLVSSERALGNGRSEDVRDVVYVRPEGFDAKSTPAIAREVEAINAALVSEGRPYLLIGFGRWGTTDPWGGIPVEWAQISGARAIVEATLPAMRTEMSQGSHFFHNLTSFRVLYLAVEEGRPIDWAYLDAQPAASETALVRHVRLAVPLAIAVDGRSGKGVVARHD